MIRETNERSEKRGLAGLGATLIGMSAAPLWTCYALLISRCERISPLLLIALCLGLAFILALRWAPVAQANLVNYLWPLLTILLTGWTLKEKVHPMQWAGVLVGFAVVAGLLTREAAWTYQPSHAKGYLMAALAAATWAVFSVLRRAQRESASESIAGFLGASAILTFALAIGLECLVWPDGAAEWSLVLIAGSGPTGLAYMAWDVEARRGNLPVMSVAAYSVPLD